MTEPAASNTIHHGRNVKRFREMRGYKQELLASGLGAEWTQKKVSILEGRQEIEDELIEQVARILEVPADAIRKFSDDAAFHIISNTFTSHDNSTSIAYQSSLNFNPIDKLVEVYEENKKLYERLLASEQEKVSLLKKISEA